MCSAKRILRAAINDSPRSLRKQISRISLLDVYDQWTLADGLRLQYRRARIAEEHRLADLPEVDLMRVAFRIAKRFGNFRLPIAHIEGIGDHARAAFELSEQLRPDREIAVVGKIQGHYRSGRQIGREKVLMADLDQLVHPSAPCVLSR